MANELPLVSVIIPMYNVEKYISETLNSILWQTLKNFEVVVVNNCSTDKSAEIVESFIPKFGGRLKLIHTKFNSGSASIPRNKGLEFSRDKYCFFMDSDDVIVINALEILYNIAEQTQSELLICKKYFMSAGVGENFLKSAKLCGDINDTTVNLLPEDLLWRLQAWEKNIFEVYPWIKFIRRDFLIENEIKFLPVVQEDSYWTLELICLAKKIILLPYPLYVYRRYQDSTSTGAFGTNLDAQNVHKKIDRIINGLKHINEFMGGIEFFKKNPAYRYALINQLVMQNIGWLMRTYVNVPPFQLYEKLKEAIEKDTDDFNILISCLISSCINMAKISNGSK